MPASGDGRPRRGGVGRLPGRHSGFALARRALSENRGWPEARLKAVQKPAHDARVVGVGGGGGGGGHGHGLATANYLARAHRLRNVAVPEMDWIGCGNVGRNTTIMRSNYMLDRTLRFYEFPLKLWERLSGGRRAAMVAHLLASRRRFSPGRFPPVETASARTGRATVVVPGPRARRHIEGLHAARHVSRAPCGFGVDPAGCDG